jgi:hypothetical protein
MRYNQTQVKDRARRVLFFQPPNIILWDHPMRFSFFVLLLAAVCTINVGCDQPAAKPENDTAAEHDHDHGGEDHGHSHAEEGHEDHASHEHDVMVEEMGPNKGHIVYLSPKDYVSEWRHYKGNSVIRVYVLDKDKKSAAVNAKVSIQPQAGKTRDPFVLQPEDGDEAGKTAVYMLDDDKLSVAMNLGVKLMIEIDGKTYQGDIPPHKPHHH